MSDHGPIQQQHKATMNALARGIDEIFNGPLPAPGLPHGPRPVCFILLSAESGKVENGRVNYISNGHREDMVAMLRELLARFEGRYAETPTTPQ
jgi:hypothetical protein